jgi:type IV secretory pathway VirJ component
VKYPSIRPATRADLEALYGDEIKPYTYRAWAAVLDGEVLGLAGMVYADDEVTVFSHGIEGAIEKYPVTAARMTVMVMKAIKGHTCKAEANEDIENAPAFLERLGFKHLDGKVWLWERT